MAENKHPRNRQKVHDWKMNDLENGRKHTPWKKAENTQLEHAHSG